MAKGLQSIKYSFLRYPNEEKIEKNFGNFFSNFFELFLKSPVRRIVPKIVKGGSLGVFEHPFFYKKVSHTHVFLLEKNPQKSEAEVTLVWQLVEASL